MSQLQKGVSIGSILTTIVLTILLSVFSWVGNATFENAVDKERMMVILETQAIQSERLVKSIDRLNQTIESMNQHITHNRENIIRLQERFRK